MAEGLVKYYLRQEITVVLATHFYVESRPGQRNKHNTFIYLYIYKMITSFLLN